MVDAYHEVEDRVTMLSNLAKALKPQGRLGIVDFRLDGTGPGPSPEERVSPDVVINDATKAGLRLIRQEPFLRVSVLPDLREVASPCTRRLQPGYRLGYSARSANIGSIRVAWRAGSHVATSATSAESGDHRRVGDRIERVHAEQQRRHQPHQRRGGREADDEARRQSASGRARRTCAAPRRSCAPSAMRMPTSRRRCDTM